MLLIFIGTSRTIINTASIHLMPYFYKLVNANHFNPLLHPFKLSDIKSFFIFILFLIYPLSVIGPFFTRPTNGQNLAVQTKYIFLGHLDIKLEWQIYISICTDL